MIPPPGFLPPHKTHLICKVHRSLYGLRQSPHQWYGTIDANLLKGGLTRVNADSNVYHLQTKIATIILILYVDDICITGSDQQGIIRLKQYLQSTYTMIDLGLLSKFLGVQFCQTSSGILMHQTAYKMQLFTEYGMLSTISTYVPMSNSLKLAKETDTPPIDAITYQRLIGELNYLTKTCWDIEFVVSLLSRFMHHPQEQHYQTALAVLQYLHPYPSLGLWYPHPTTRIFKRRLWRRHRGT